MRRLVALLVASSLVVATTAEPKVLVVGQTLRTTNDPASQDEPGLRTMLDYTIALLDRFGVDYKHIAPAQARTEWCRTGTQVWNAGTAGAYTEQFDAVLHVCGNSAGATSGYNVQRYGIGSTDRPDSLGLANLAGGYPTVPQIIFDYESNMSVSAGRCSTGANTGSVPGVPYNYNSVTKYLAHRPDVRWRSGVYDGVSLTYTPPGGARVLIAQNSGGGHFYEQAQAMPCGASDCDSIVATSDTVLAWARLNANVAGAAQIVYTIFNHLPNEQMDPMIPLMTLAYVDSLTGGDVLTNKNKLPLRVGVHVRGGWRRNSPHNMGGIPPHDSTALKASVDSLASLNIPFAVGVNVDSLHLHMDDRNWWLRAAPYVRFTPEMRAGLDSAAAGNGGASWQQPRDVFGRYRNRWINVKNGTTDTMNVGRLARAAFWKCDSAFGFDRVDRLIIPPDDDLWAYNWRINTNNGSLDSLFSALADSTGARGIVINPTADGQLSGAVNVKSPLRSQRPFLMTMGRSAGSNFNVIATAAPQDSGSARFSRGNTVDRYQVFSPLANVQSFFQSAFGYARIGSGGGTLPGDSLQTRMSIYTIHASDLGSGVHSSGRATRPGWYQVKYIANTIKAVNILAGKTIISIEYPQNLP